MEINKFITFKWKNLMDIFYFREEVALKIVLKFDWSPPQMNCPMSLNWQIKKSRWQNDKEKQLANRFLHATWKVHLKLFINFIGLFNYILVVKPNSKINQ